MSGGGVTWRRDRVSSAPPAATDRGAPRITVINPLPRALARYELAVTAVLEQAGALVHRTPFPTAEIGGAGALARVRAAVAGASARRRLPRDEATLVLWPALGFLEPWLWPQHSARLTVVCHDPEPLRRQPGLGSRSARLGAWRARRTRLTTLAHSAPASAALAARAWPDVLELPLPIGPLAALPCLPRTTIAVLGQNKAARSLDQLATVAAAAAHAAPGHRLTVAGRGWPELPGWQVDARFLSESEFDDRLDRAAAVIVPYTTFFQSDVAARALSRLAPVVGLRHPFLAQLYGRSWPGLVDHDTYAGWRDALAAAIAVPTARLVEIRDTYASTCTEAWRAALPSLTRPAEQR